MPGGWFRCHVQKVGPSEEGKVYFTLKDTGGQFNHWFYAFDGMKREMLATALTAISTGLAVDVALTTTDEYSQVNRMYIVR